MSKPSLVLCVGLCVGLCGSLGLTACTPPQPTITEVLNHNHCRTLQPGARLVGVHELPQIRGVRLLEAPSAQGDPRVEENTLLVATSRGPQASAGYSLELLGGTQEKDHVVLDYRWHTPPSGTAQAQMLTSPCSVVQLRPTVPIDRVRVRIDGEAHAEVATLDG